MLLCGFEKFDNFFVRIDILERLFVQIINTNPEKEKEIKCYRYVDSYTIFAFQNEENS